MSDAFHALTIAEVRNETADAISLRLTVPDDVADRFRFRPGQHLTVRAGIEGKEVRRNYSLCVAPHENMLKVAVKRIAGGLFSNWAADSLQPGDVIEAMPPHGSFTADFVPGHAAHYAGFAGGSGITPILSLLKAALATEVESQFTLFYGNRDSSSVIFLEELAQIKNRYMDRFEIFNFLSDEAEELELFNGVLDQQKCEEILDHLVDASQIERFFICGPGPMMNAAESALKGRGVASSSIQIERFTVDRPPAAIAAAIAAQTEKVAGAEMKLTLDGRTRIVRFDAKAGNILDSARNSGLPAPYACKAGVCATCRARVVSGKVTMAARYGLTDTEIADGYVLTCQSIPDGDGLVLDYDA